MCRLLGIIANKLVDLEFSLERFKEFASQNPDGWGLDGSRRGNPKFSSKEYWRSLRRVSYPYYRNGSDRES